MKYTAIKIPMLFTNPLLFGVGIYKTYRGGWIIKTKIKS
jgi:hypothetical protein